MLYILVYPFKEDVTCEKLLPRCPRLQAPAAAHAERRAEHGVPRARPLGTACSWASNGWGLLLQYISSGDDVGQPLRRPFSAAGSGEQLLDPRTPPHPVFLLTQHCTSPARAPG